MGDTEVLSGTAKGEALADDVDAAVEEASGGDQVKGTRTGSVPGGVLKKCNDAVRGAFAVVAASPVLRAFAAVFSKFTPARAAFLVSTLVALWRSAGQPFNAVWTFTVISIFYLGLWTLYLSKAIPPLTVLVSLTYVMLLAISVTHLSAAAGVFVMILDTAYAAGLFGYALAEYRLRKGYEQSAKALQTRVKLEGLKNDDDVITMVSLYATIASLFSAAGAAWIICYMTDMYWVVVLLSLLIDLSLFCWAGLVGMHLLHGVLFADDHIAFLFWGTALLVLPDFLLSYMFGQSIGVLVHPTGVMGVAGVLGYSLSVYVFYKHISAE